MKFAIYSLSALTVLTALSWQPVQAKKEFVSKKTGSGAKAALGEGTQKTPSGLQYKDLTVGTGAAPKENQVVRVDYIGWVMPDEREFDNSIKRGTPLPLILGANSTCKGFEEGIATMKVGGTRLLLVPPALGYPKGLGTFVPPDSTLKYKVTLVHIGTNWVPPKKSPATTDGKKPEKTGTDKEKSKSGV